MKITIKIKYLMGAMLAISALVFFNFNASAEGPKAYVRYTDQVETVLASVYWDGDSNQDYIFQYANDMNKEGSDLDWEAGVVTKLEDENTFVANVIMSKYKNYYFKIFPKDKEDDEEKITIVRAFPGDLGDGSNPERKSSDYAHGNFTPDTTMCGSCHDTHSSVKSQLLKQSTYYDLCMLCHSNSNTQSKYDVEMGRTFMGEAGWQDSLAGPIGTGVGTSAHDINDNFNTTVSVPGGSSGGMLTFTCISCHTAHGGTNDNYRLLRKEIYPTDSSEPIEVDFKAFSVVQDDHTEGEQVYLKSGSTEFCLACHTNFKPGSLEGGHSLYEHPVTVGESVYSVYKEPRDLFPSYGDRLPLQYDRNYSGNSVSKDKRTAIVCLTCHFAHGTRKSYSINEGAWNPEIIGDGFSSPTGKYLLRLDNYGVCQSCHKK